MHELNTIGVYPGSFDPITLGHLELINTASKMFSKLYVIVAHNPDKKTLFNSCQRKGFIINSLSPDLRNNVEVDIFEGLIANYCMLKGARYIVRGLRTNMDFEKEMTMAFVNQQLDSSIQTIFIPCAPSSIFVSSSVVKELARHDGDISKYVPDHVAQYFKTYAVF